MDFSLINWKNSENNFLVNPRWPSEVQEFFKQGINNAVSQNQIESSIFVPTSGTTSIDLRDTKIVWLKKESFLKAAEAVGTYFKFSSSDRVAIALPKFHVGGISQDARQHLWGHKVFDFSSPWEPKLFFEFLQQHRITHTSLVPTQLFDLVQAGLSAPAHLKCIFLGGGAIGKELQDRAASLGWSLHFTYGMTETAALVATDEGDGFKPLPHAEMTVSSGGFLKIKAGSLFSGYLRRRNQDLILDQAPVVDGWFTTEDLAQEFPNGFKILGRTEDYAKIGGEGVYLGRLQTLLQDCWLQKGLDLGTGVLKLVASDRLGAEIHLFSTLSETNVREVLEAFNKKVLPFERIRGFHQVREIPLTELGKVRAQEIK